MLISLPGQWCYVTTFCYLVTGLDFSEIQILYIDVSNLWLLWCTYGQCVTNLWPVTVTSQSRCDWAVIRLKKCNWDVNNLGPTWGTDCSLFVTSLWLEFKYLGLKHDNHRVSQIYVQNLVLSQGNSEWPMEVKISMDFGFRNCFLIDF